MQDYLMTADGLIAHHLALEFNKLMGQGATLPKSGNFFVWRVDSAFFNTTNVR